MYIIFSKNQFLVVDPCVNFENVKNDIMNLQCVGIFLTHAHFDPFCEIKSWIDKGKVFLHQNALQKL